MNSEKRKEIENKADGCNPTNRTYKELAPIFGYLGHEETLRGKSILDIGGGRSFLGIMAARMGFRLTTLDPQFADIHMRDEMKKFLRWRNFKRVGALAQELPFADNTFDEVISCHVFRYISIADGLKLALSEALRVVKPGGLVKIAPTWFLDISESHMILRPPFLNIFSFDGDTNCLVAWKSPEWSMDQAIKDISVMFDSVPVRQRPPISYMSIFPPPPDDFVGFRINR